MAGLEHRFNVERVDGKPVGRVFVLTPEKDIASWVALANYGQVIEDENPELANDLREWLREAWKGHPEWTEEFGELDG